MRRKGVKGLVIMMVAAVVLVGGQSVGQATENPPALEETNDPGDVLARVELFSQLTENEIAVLKPAARLYRGKAGEQVITQGRYMDRMFIVLDGKADIRIHGKSLVVLTGQILLGEIEFLGQGPATADVILLKDADCLVLDNGVLNRVMEDHPRVGYVIYKQMARIVAERLRRNNAKK